MAPYAIHEVSDGIWRVKHQARGACAYVVKTSPGALVIDAGPLAAAPGVMMALQKARVGLASVRALLMTHWSEDHSGGAAAFAARSGTRLLCAPAHEARLRSALAGSTPAPEGVLRRGMRIEGTVEVVSAADSPGEFTAFYLARTRTLFPGDGAAEAAGLQVERVLPGHEPAGRTWAPKAHRGPA